MHLFSLPKLWRALEILCRHRQPHILLTFAGLLMGRPSLAQDTTLVRLLRRNSYPLSQVGTRFAGTGWDRLRQDVRQSQFVLLGEDHGTAQIPLLAQALAQEQRPALYVAEIDPYQAQDLTQLAAQPGLPSAYLRQHPLGLSFYSWTEEFELVRYFRTQQVPLVGIDQVSITSTGRLLTRLAGQVRSQTTKRALLERAATYQAQDISAMRQANNRYSLATLPTSALDSLRQLTHAESPAVKQQIRDLTASSEIYRLSSSEGSRSHQLRISLMKQKLLQVLKPYQTGPGQPLPKLFFKFGAFHMSRGLSLVAGVYDVGNLVANLADAQQAQSLHLLVVGKQGTKLEGFNPDDFSKNTVAYSNMDEKVLAPFLRSVIPTATWQVTDLRPIRQALLRDELKAASQDIATTILGYDYLIVIPETTASRNY